MRSPIRRLRRLGSQQNPEKFISTKEAARLLGLPTWKLARIIRLGLIPHYTPYNSRKLIRLNEVLAYIERTRKGGEEQLSKRFEEQENLS